MNKGFEKKNAIRELCLSPEFRFVSVFHVYVNANYHLLVLKFCVLYVSFNLKVEWSITEI